MRIRGPIAVALAVTVGVAGTPSGMARAEERAAAAITLPEVRRQGPTSVERALADRRSRRRYADEPLPLSEAAQLLWAAQGVTHAKGLRTAPSAGALYPLEVYLVAGMVTGLEPGLYRYEPEGHRLTPRLEGDLRAALSQKALEQSWVADAPALLVITAVVRRSARKYGRRAERYALIEAGHAAQNVYLQAEALGLATVIVGAFQDAPLARVLELPRGEQPIGLMPVGRRAVSRGRPGG